MSMYLNPVEPSMPSSRKNKPSLRKNRKASKEYSTVKCLMLEIKLRPINQFQKTQDFPNQT